MVVQFSRDPKSFAINRYAQIVPVKKHTGYYLRINAEQAGRILNTDLREFAWHDAADAPSGTWGTEKFEFFQFACQRFAFAFRLGYLTTEQADWNILASHAAIAAQQAMTARTVQAVAELDTAGNYATGHDDTATNWGGGKWDAGTDANPFIKKAVLKMARQIFK